MTLENNWEISHYNAKQKIRLQPTNKLIFMYYLLKNEYYVISMKITQMILEMY